MRKTQADQGPRSPREDNTNRGLGLTPRSVIGAETGGIGRYRAGSAGRPRQVPIRIKPAWQAELGRRGSKSWTLHGKEGVRGSSPRVGFASGAGRSRPLDLLKTRRAAALDWPGPRGPAGSFRACCVTVGRLCLTFRRSHGSRRRPNCRHPRLRGVQAAQLPDREVQAERPGADRAAQVLPLVRPSHVAQGDPLMARHARAYRERS
jgi:hypothetical protein